MLSIVLTYRNRDVTIVERCLNSLAAQSDTNFELFVVDYGSDDDFANALQTLATKYSFVTHIYVPAKGQLWNKSRAINIALKQCKHPYFLMGDIDLIYHPDMVKKCKELLVQHNVVFFKYGFLSKDETALQKDYFTYEPEFYGDDNVTGTTLYKTDVLKSVNGYDEFYHGWGAEDTDVHLRLKNAGYTVLFYKEEVLVKHQWHPKAYRTKNSSAPFHTKLEKVNHEYMHFNNALKITVANQNQQWGIVPAQAQVAKLAKASTTVTLTNEKNTFDAFVFGVLPQTTNVLTLTLKENVAAVSLKNKLKKYANKKSIETYTLEEVNNMLLYCLITNHRLASYQYKIDWQNKTIALTLSPYVST